MVRTPKKAKCNIHTLSFCNNKHDSPQCAECILVKHRDKKYIYKDGHRYKLCPQCNQYKLLSEYYINAKGHYGWCKECHKEYKHICKYDEQSFMISYKNENGMRKFIKVNSANKMIKLVKQHMIENNERFLEIKRI